MKKVVQLKHYQAAYLEEGAGIPILCLHGFLGDGTAWLPLIVQRATQSLAQQPIRWIALDLLGFGESSKPELRYNIWHQVAFLQEFIGALELDQFWLMGHSYGGWTAAAYAIACATGAYGLPQERQPMSPPHSACAGLILVAPAGIRDDQFVGRYAHLRPLLWESPWIDWGIKALAPLSQWVGQQKTFAQIQQVRQALTEQPVAKSFIRDRLRPEDAIDTLEQDLHHITLPTLILAAAEDDTIPLWHCETYAQGIPNAALHIFEKATHALPQTHPAAIAQQLSDFLKAKI